MLEQFVLASADYEGGRPITAKTSSLPDENVVTDAKGHNCWLGGGNDDLMNNL
jgi:hypothetical protein